VVFGARFGLLTLNVRVVAPFSGTPPAPKVLWITGGAITVIDAVVDWLVPPSVEPAITLLLWTPAAVPVTFTEKEQPAPLASDAPDRLTLLPPAVALMVCPPHVLGVNPLGVATTRPEGKVSVKLTLVRATAGFVLGFEMEKVRVVD